MTVEYLWTLPTRGGGRAASPAAGGNVWAGGTRPLGPSIRDVRPGRYTNFDHLAQIGRAAAAAGFAGVVVPFDPEGEESWVVGASLARQVPKLVVVTEFSPAFATPVYLTKMSTTFQRFSGGRLRWQLAIEGDPAVDLALGDRLQGDDRYDRAAELLEISEAIWGGTDVTYRGRFYEVEAGGLADPLTRDPRPAVVLSGSSSRALALSAAHADVHLWELGPADEEDQQEALRASLDEQAATGGRRLRHGLRLSLLVRATAREAWDEARRRWSEVGAGSQSHFDALVTGPDTWAGFRQVGQVASTGLVGSYDQVAERLQKATDAGVEVFSLEASPGIDEAYRFVEHLAPHLFVDQPLRRKAV